ncbi:biopolymer transporter ExbD [Blochmannia endosymbiont of Colobopsis nipponica]|uniref:biopolymer transporter ExbD n=1 Tax=Blochmannia endosymbiont of Colobopsis nipponica TaxID=2681987 RepID=UPI001784B6C1|nr:biopolymer transporter ExbD [Blochmannia endosymbiont of Colobopsis nipponica]QOI11108.1 biopolymer transporter ExbD [Blochmannia endosymbiont of Colobopsis nipponica]
MNYQRQMYRKIKSEINIVPLLDILLVLLIVLMIVPSVLNHNLEVELPTATNSKKIIHSSDSSIVIIEVLGREHYNLIINGKKEKKISSEQIFTKLREEINTNSDTIFLVGGDKNVVYKEIVKILNLLHKAGIKSVSMMTKII